MWEREVKQREPDQEDVPDDIFARRIGKSHADRGTDAKVAVEPGKETRDNAMPPDAALRFALEISDPTSRAHVGKGPLESAFDFLVDDDARATALARLAVADALAAREMFLRLRALDALGAASSLVNALAPHVAGPALGVAPDPRWTGWGVPHALATACERRGAAIYRKANGDGDREHPAVLTALARRGSGEPLPDELRRAMEERLGARFDRVRVHTDAVAAEAANAVGARAFTVGEDIFFATGAFTAAGDDLLVHELAHVVQAQQGRTASAGMSRPGDELEREADDVAARAAPQPPADDREHAFDGEAPAASEMLLRDDKKEIESLVESWIKAPAFTIKKNGQLTSAMSGEKVRLQGPPISATADVSMKLPDDQKLGSKTIKVGPIQTLTSSTRTGVYAKDGQTEEISHSMGQARDAAEGAYNDDGPFTPFAKAESPFYSGNATGDQPGGQGDLETWSGDQTTYTAKVGLADRPGFAMPSKLPNGKVLTAIKGSDNFNTSAGFKVLQTNQIVALAPFGWSLSWDTPIAADGTAQPDPKRDAITLQKVDLAIYVDSPDYANLMARQEFDSLDDAMKHDGWELLKILPAVRSRNARAGGFIEQALVAKNPRFKVTVVMNRGAGQAAIKDGDMGTDDVGVSVSSSITKSSPEEKISARQGLRAAVNVSLNQLAAPKDITSGSTMSVNVHEDKKLGGNATFTFPFTGTSAVGQSEGSQGDYTIIVEQA